MNCTKKQADEVYYKICICSDGQLRPVCVQWFDELDYGDRLLPVSFRTEQEAWATIFLTQHNPILLLALLGG